LEVIWKKLDIVSRLLEAKCARLDKREPVTMRAVAIAAFLAASGTAMLFLVQPITAQSTAGVTVQGYAFSPNTITVVIGVNNTVTWTNQDPVAHRVTADDQSWGGSLAAGATYTHTFSAVGIYSYHCSIHTYMKGIVIVEAQGTSSTSTTSSSSASSTSSSSNGSGGGIPEFPFQTLAAAVITTLILASYFVVRVSQRAPFNR